MLTASQAAAGLTDEGVMTTVSGWGNTVTTQTLAPDTLQVVNVPIVSNQAANDAYGRGMITDDMLAAGILGVGGKDACQGDSERPLVAEDQDGNAILAGMLFLGGMAVQTPIFLDFIQEFPILKTDSFKAWKQ